MTINKVFNADIVDKITSGENAAALVNDQKRALNQAIDVINNVKEASDIITGTDTVQANYSPAELNDAINSLVETAVPDGTEAQIIAGTDTTERKYTPADINGAIKDIAVAQYAGRTAMKAITGLTAGDVVYLSEGGRSGAFETLPAGDYSAEIAADPLEGVYVLLDDGQTLKRRLNGYVTPEMFGAVSGSDITSELQSSINIAESEGVSVAGAEGDFTYSGEVLISDAIEVKFSGIRRTIFRPAPLYTGWFLQILESNFIDSDNFGPVTDLSNDTSGLSLSGFSIRSSRNLGYGAQNGIRCVGRNDRMVWNDIYTECLEGTAFYFGHQNGLSTNPAFMRECEFNRVESRACGDVSNQLPSVVFDSYGSGDATNLCNFYSFRVVYPYYKGVVIENNSTLNAIRRIKFFSTLLHGAGATGIPTTEEQMTIRGNVKWLDFHSLQLNSTISGQTSVLIDAYSGSSPSDLYFFADISSGDGDSFNINSADGVNIDCASWSASGVDLTVGSGASGYVIIDSRGQSFTKSIDPAASDIVSCLTSYDDEVPVRTDKIVMGNLTTSPHIIEGSVVPEGVVSAPAASSYLNRGQDGQRNCDSMYLKRGGTGSTGWDSIQLVVGGSTAQRPSTPTTHQMYFDTTLGKPIWYDDTNWVDATGTTV